MRSGALLNFEASIIGTREHDRWVYGDLGHGMSNQILWCCKAVRKRGGVLLTLA
jgi:hypothetical protein